MARRAAQRRNPWSARANLNLASNPSGGYRAFLALSGIAAAALLVAAVQLVVQFAGSSGPPEALLSQERQLAELQRSLARQGAEAGAKIDAAGTAEILDRTVFLNDLLIRKGISWTRTFLDLEQVLPPEVRVLTIQPEVAYHDRIRLDMTVSAKQPADFIGFLKTLEESDLFGSPALRGSAPPTESDPTFHYELAVEYGQQL